MNVLIVLRAVQICRVHVVIQEFSMTEDSLTFCTTRRSKCPDGSHSKLVEYCLHYVCTWLCNLMFDVRSKPGDVWMDGSDKHKTFT